MGGRRKLGRCYGDPWSWDDLSDLSLTLRLQVAGCTQAGGLNSGGRFPLSRCSWTLLHWSPSASRLSPGPGGVSVLVLEGFLDSRQQHPLHAACKTLWGLTAHSCCLCGLPDSSPLLTVLEPHCLCIALILYTLIWFWLMGAYPPRGVGTAYHLCAFCCVLWRRFLEKGAYKVLFLWKRI